jgi:hypothetical protein
MATIFKVCRKSHDACKAVIRLRGIKPFSKTFKLKKDAKVWAIRMERDIDEARAYGLRCLTRYVTRRMGIMCWEMSGSSGRLR